MASEPVHAPAKNRSRSNSTLHGDAQATNQHYQNLLNKIKHKNVDKPADEPTVKEFQAFDPKNDAEALFNSMKGLGTEESSIIDVLTQRSNRQRQEISFCYKQTYGKDIAKAFKGELKIIIHGHFEDVIGALLKPHDFYDAELLHNAISGLTTDEDVLIDIACSRTSAELETIRKTYLLQYGRELTQDIDKHVHGTRAFKKLLEALMTGARESDDDMNEEQAKWDARAMYDAGPRHWASDEAFVPIFADRSYAHLRIVFAEFEKIADLEIDKVVGKELHDDVGHLLESLVKFTKNKYLYFAELLHSSFKGLGTNHKRLIRTIVSRCEFDLATINERYEQKYHKTLGSIIASETSGSYRNVLLALGGFHDELRRHDHSHSPNRRTSHATTDQNSPNRRASHATADPEYKTAYI